MCGVRLDACVPIIARCSSCCAIGLLASFGSIFIISAICALIANWSAPPSLGPPPTTLAPAGIAFWKDQISESVSFHWPSSMQRTEGPHASPGHFGSTLGSTPPTIGVGVRASRFSRMRSALPPPCGTAT